MAYEKAINPGTKRRNFDIVSRQFDVNTLVDLSASQPLLVKISNISYVNSGDLCAAIDLGGTKIALAISNINEPKNLIAQMEIPTPNNKSPWQIVEYIAHTLANFFNDQGVHWADVAIIGCGFPGVLKNGVVKSCVVLPQFSKAYPLAQELQKALRIHSGWHRLKVFSDIEIAIIGEKELNGWQGDFNYVTYSTGFGIGHFSCGEVVDTAIVDHIFPDPKQPQQTIENLVSGTALAQKARKKVQESVDSIILLLTPKQIVENITAKELGQAAIQGDALALSILNEAGQHISVAFQKVIEETGITHFVIGGGVTQIGKPLKTAIENNLQNARVPSDTRVSFSELGHNRSTVGALVASANFLKRPMFPESIISGKAVAGQWLSQIESNSHIIITTQNTLKTMNQMPWHSEVQRQPIVILNELSDLSLPQVFESMAIANDVLTHDLESIIAIGGGTAIDAAKLMAAMMGIPCTALPSSSSTNTMFTFKSAIRNLEGTYSKHTGAPQLVIFDWQFMQAFSRGNRAGSADVLSALTALNDWNRAVNLGVEKPHSEQLNRTYMVLDNLLEQAEKIGENSPEGISTVVNMLIEISILVMELGAIDSDLAGRPDAASEHQLVFAIEQKLPAEVHILHGELVAIAILVMIYLQEGEAAYQKTKKVMKKLRLPTHIKEVHSSLTANVLIDALQLVRPRPGRHSWWDDHTFSKAEATKLVRTIFLDDARLD